MQNLPNLITISRIFISVIVPILIMVDDDDLRLLAFILFAIAAVSDWLDGYLARRLDAVSELGRMIDPITDKLLIAGTLLALAATDSWDWLMLIPSVLILLREIFVSGLREFMATYKLTIRVTSLAKIKTVVQFIAIGFALFVPLLHAISDLALILMWAAGILTAITGWDYLKKVLAHGISTR
jgi:CDP-diacylglycerol--glycerol-3-phosphate 3-phosphatidyltransferase